jgi:hypothetical protein
MVKAKNLAPTPPRPSVNRRLDRNEFTNNSKIIHNIAVCRPRKATKTGREQTNLCIDFK